MFIRNTNGHLISGLAAGALVGLATGLLFARQPGQETRHQLKHKAGHQVSNLRERFRRESNGDSPEDQVAVHSEPSD